MFKNFSFIILLIILLILFGTAGYMIIEKWSFVDSLYMTIITLSTVGYKEIHPLSQNGRLFTIVFISFGLLVLAIIISKITSIILQGELGKILGRRKMEKKIQNLKNHYIICGLGNVGVTCLNELTKMNIPVVGIDRNIEVIEEIQNSGSTLLIKGDATEDTILIKAGIERAKGIITCLPEDAENLYVVITARSLKPDIRIIAMANEERALRKIKNAGADYVILPKQIAGLRMASVAIRPDVVSFLDVMMRDVEESWRIEQAVVPKNSPFIGKSLREAEIPSKTGLLVIAMRKKDGEFLYNPPAGTILEKEDILLVLGNQERLERLRVSLESGQ